MLVRLSTEICRLTTRTTALFLPAVLEVKVQAEFLHDLRLRGDFLDCVWQVRANYPGATQNRQGRRQQGQGAEFYASPSRESRSELQTQGAERQREVPMSCRNARGQAAHAPDHSAGLSAPQTQRGAHCFPSGYIVIADKFPCSVFQLVA